jgi:hypothetical protein
MHEALAWLLEHYEETKLWMGVETEAGAELYLTCMPAQAALVEQLRQYEDDGSIFEEVTGFSADSQAPSQACVNE